MTENKQVFPTAREWQGIYDVIVGASSDPVTQLKIAQAICAEMQAGHDWDSLEDWLLDIGAGSDFTGGQWIPDEWYLGNTR